MSISRLGMAEKTNASGGEAAQVGAAPEDEVYSALGALLGTLEVVVSDDAHPLPPLQEKRLRSALQLCGRLQTHVESLLTLAAEDLGARLRRSHCVVRPLVEHAVRGAVRRFEARAVALRLPAVASWGQERVLIDASRVDRTLRALAEALADSVGHGGTIEVVVRPAGAHVALVLIGHAGGSSELGSAVAAPLLERAARRLFELHGGSLSLDSGRPAIEILLPISELP